MTPRALSRLSRIWFPSGGIAASGIEDGYAKLIRAGFLRQSHAGIFHMLPLGRRVQDKIETLIAKHMEETLAASRVSMSTISTEALWEKSGRLQSVASELFRFSDRKNAAYLLSPTHEEEITSLVARTVKSYKELPLRLYQITRKYRDEFRPRHGLLRGREFTMKDLYTFDASRESALATYDSVRAAYSRIFAEMRLPVLVAKASSGDMGGDLSHEYHLPTPLGEDYVVSCNSCDHVINEELAESAVADEAPPCSHFTVWRGISNDKSTLVNVWYPRTRTQLASGESSEYTDSDVNIHAVKSVVPDLNAGVENVVSLWSAAVNGPERTATRLLNMIDGRLPRSIEDDLTCSTPSLPVWPDELNPPHPGLAVSVHFGDGKPLNLLRIRPGDQCPKCSTGSLQVQKAIELGHTFHLGTRYSEPLDARVSVPASVDPVPGTSSSQAHESGRLQIVPMQMGCHGIGISRIIGAVAEHLADKKGLNWPVVIAPYSCVIVPGRDASESDVVQVYQHIAASVGAEDERLDVAFDDRTVSLPWKLTDADLIGIPIIVVLGREWPSSRRVEVQCRRLGTKDLVGMDDLPGVLKNMLAAL
ncbi:proline--tRNA ligase [Diplogelasinospora grovesii]|uniref:proline--tRNA ligase n=1 Tax=Diplogelasinospora grovesii TaxID=303347 RepID=A0AAN6NHK1_9PEZI|nr:proline--tRNA ligase [Diplogelasinospora grovesii]